MIPPNSDDEETHAHYGKGMLIVADGQLTITFECNLCGRFTAGPIPIGHAANIAQQMIEWCEETGIPVGTRQVVEVMSGDDPELIADGRAKFESMTLKDDGGDSDDTSAWDS